MTTYSLFNIRGIFGTIYCGFHDDFHTIDFKTIMDINIGTQQVISGFSHIIVHFSSYPPPPPLSQC